MWAIIHQELDEMISNHPALKDIGVGSTRHPCIAGCFFVSIQASLAGWNVLFEVLNTSHPDGSAVRVPPPPRLLFSPIIQASFSGERTRRGLELIGSGGLEGFGPVARSYEDTSGAIARSDTLEHQLII